MTMVAVSAWAGDSIEEAGPNLLANPSFEEGVGENGVPLGWTLYGGLDEQRKITLVDGAIDGAKVVRIEDGDQQGEVGLRQQVAVEGGKAYLATISVKSLGQLSPGGSYLQLRYFPSNEFVQRGLIPGLGGLAAEIHLGKVAPSGTTSATLYIYTHSGPRPKVLVDDARLQMVKSLPDQVNAPSVAKVPEITALKPLYLETLLLRRGQAASIVVPAGGRYDRAANKIASVMQTRGGVRPPIIQDTTFNPALDLRTHLIVLGNRSTNRLLATLYERYYTLLDLRYPGAGGYVVRTLHNPTGSGKNVVLVGGSDDEGVERAADVLIEKIEASALQEGCLSIGRLMEIQLGTGIVLPTELEKFETWEASVGYGSIGYFGWNSISKRMAMYYMTGDPFHAREVIRLAFPDARALEEISKIDGERIENKDDPLSGPYHYNAHMMILYWDLIEESPVFSDEERLRVTRAFAQQLSHHGIQRAYRGPYAAVPASVGSRHGQWTAISLYCLGRYFSKDYANPVWPVCEENGTLHFRPLHEHAWVSGESDNLFWYNTATAPILTYMMLSGDRVPLENGVLGRLLRAQEALVSGRQGDWALRYGAIGYFHKAADLTGDGRWLEYVRRTGINRDIFRLGQSYWPVPDLVANHPEDLAGVWTVNTLPEAMWRVRRNGFELEESFQFASYRNRADAAGDYMLLDGYNGASRNPYHTFALLELRQDGETILEGYLNQLRTRADGLTEHAVAMDGALRHRSVLGEMAVAVGEVPKAAHANWRRSIVNRAGRYTLIADALTPRIDTKNFEIQLSWESKRSHWKLDGTHYSRLLATNPTDSAKTATVATSRAMQTRLDGMRATLTWVGPAGDGTVQHLFSVVGRGEASGKEGIVAAPLGDAAAAVLRLPELAVAVSGRYAEVEAELALLAEDHLYGLGLRTARGLFSTDAPVEIFWDFTAGEAIVVAARRTNMCMLLDPANRLLVDGKDADVTILDGITHLELAAGTWRLTGALLTAAMLEANRQWLALTVNEATVAFETKSSTPEVAPANLQALSAESTFDCGEKVTDLIQIPLDGRLELAAAAGTTIHLFTEQGALLKRMETDSPIRMLRWWAEPRLLLAGCVDEKVIAFSDRGERAWVFVSEMDPAVFRAAKTYWFKSAAGHEGIHGLYTGVFLDGKSQAFVGSACTLEIIDDLGQLVKRMPQFWGKVSLFKIIPTAEDRLTLLAGRKYNGWNSLGVIHNSSLNPDQRGFHSVPQGHTSIGGWSSMNRHHLFFEDFDGDGEKEVMSEINGSWNRVSVWDKHGVAKYDASFGPGKRIPAKNIRDIDTADLDGDGISDIVVAESTGIVVALKGTCERIWGMNVDGCPMVMNCVIPANGNSPMIVVGNADGGVKVLDHAGSCQWIGSVRGVPSCIVKLGRGKVAVATEKGEVDLFGL